MKKISKIVVLFCGVVGLVSVVYTTALADQCPKASEIKYNSQTGVYVGPDGWQATYKTGTNKIHRFYDVQLTNDMSPGSTVATSAQCTYALKPLSLGYLPLTQAGQHHYKHIGPNWHPMSPPPEPNIGYMCGPPVSDPASCLFKVGAP
ncbi:MAG: hypothetical protein A3I77_00380 [Gammaproteobacteria bacterium RIFCSPLOWO2_02_FULL_42_14]|nr:MAG: hypothetical protein A3B71_08465 [Gammaproteobacteria bacterium RIFCSPHIGHO2_02_FULL_42_43]OGT50742.1 MAG: hypothetical protein A3E54_00660 [Gammaproteobacteria bacterium RIFCSPHIGHO2_12_FULL_41_25]OGT61728.1 MAG: hypothetical protein A3I77_00380 [Gammaproteobacteria bacterium RIFCSPLOWO2_02_FULL_42_14]OGT85471.1 MAG: hypothetical protein A3G86_06570 [Gammaproteobacteria bacterium RIFCSPLOWO2_12_FULL_42_18]